MKTSDFYYDLPEELIAQTPLERRDASRLMVLDRRTGEVTHRHFYDIVEYLQPGDCLWTLAEQYYGDGAQYKKLAAANPDIKNPNLIYPGQVLTIPPADDLPAAGQDSASVALSDSLEWTGSGWTAA